MSEEARVPVQNKNSLIALLEEARVPVQHRNSSEMAVPIEICRDVLGTCRDVHLGTCRDVHLGTCRDVLGKCRDVGQVHGVPTSRIAGNKNHDDE